MGGAYLGGGLAGVGRGRRVEEAEAVPRDVAGAREDEEALRVEGGVDGDGVRRVGEDVGAGGELFGGEAPSVEGVHAVGVVAGDLREGGVDALERGEGGGGDALRGRDGELRGVEVGADRGRLAGDVEVPAGREDGGALGDAGGEGLGRVGAGVAVGAVEVDGLGGGGGEGEDGGEAARELLGLLRGVLPGEREEAHVLCDVQGGVPVGVGGVGGVDALRVVVGEDHDEGLDGLVPPAQVLEHGLRGEARFSAP